MPQCTGHARARRKKLFARISSSTFIKKPNSNSSILESGKILHSKSTYFYRWGSRLSSKLNYIVPSVCTLALLIGGIVAINPRPGLAYAEGEEDTGIMPLAADSTISLRFNDDASFTTPATANEVAYITNTFTVNVNKYANYTVKLNAMNGSGTELRGKDNAFATIKGVGTNKTITEFADDTWGYSYKENPSGDLKTIAAGLRYNSMPAYGSEEAMVTKNLSGNEENLVDNYLLAFAAKISSNSPADHYIGNFLLSVVGLPFTPETYYLTYNANSGTGGPTQQSCTQTSYQSPCNIVITNEVPTRAGYTFLGWADSSTAGTASYSAGSTITLSKSQTLYAVWEADIMFDGITTMQAMTSTICNHAEENDTARLRDTRDNKLYWVTKLKDGNCWMTQNLDYDGAGKQVTTPLNHSENGWQYNSGATQFYDPGEYAFDKTVGAASCDSQLNGLAGCTNKGWFNVKGWTASDRAKNEFSIDSGNKIYDAHYLVGNFYSWDSVTNETGNNLTNQSSYPANASGSICPSGWRLPSATGSASFNSLFSGLDTSSDQVIRGEPYYFLLAGRILNNSGLNNVGSMGWYWSWTASMSTQAYALSFSSSNVNTAFDVNRYTGFPARCLFKAV